MSGTVLLTGATGFVGRQVLRKLCERGVQTRVIVRQGKESLVSQSKNIAQIITTNDLFVETSDWWKQAGQVIEAVICCAWYGEIGQ